MKKAFLLCWVLALCVSTQAGASLITMDEIGQSGEYFSAESMFFVDKKEKASYESDFGLYSKLDPTNRYQVFSYDEEPLARSLVTASNWAPLAEGFGFYFDVHTGGQSDASAEFSWFSDSSLNRLADGTAQDRDVDHVLTNLVNKHFLYVSLDDQLGGGDRDFNDMRVNGLSCEITQVPVAPVPEPATLLLVGTGLIGVVGSRLRKKKEKD